MNYGMEEDPIFHTFIHLDLSLLSLTPEINLQNLIQRWIKEFFLDILIHTKPKEVSIQEL